MYMWDIKPDELHRGGCNVVQCQMALLNDSLPFGEVTSGLIIIRGSRNVIG